MPDILGVGGAGIDPASVMACSWAVAGIPKRGEKDAHQLKSCRGYTSAQWSFEGHACRVAESFLIKAWHFCPSFSVSSWFSAEMLSR